MVLLMVQQNYVTNWRKEIEGFVYFIKRIQDLADVYIYNYYYYNESLSHSLLGTMSKVEYVSKALQHMVENYKHTKFEKYIRIEIEENELNEVWYRIKYNDNKVDTKKMWKKFLEKKEYSFFEYSKVMKIKYILIKLRIRK